MTPTSVTVIVSTYNHERFVRQALDSVLAQETSFPVDVVVIDDCSTDGTPAIIDEFVRRYPGQVVRTGPPTNQNDNLAFARAVLAASGRYIAVLHGDDYWTSRTKLQTQADFLDANASCALCYHNLVMEFEDGRTGTMMYNPPGQARRSTMADLWQRNFIATCSVVFRQGLIRTFPAWYQHARWGDWPLLIMLAEDGTIGCIDTVLGVYRIHPQGIWSQLSDIEQLEGVIEFLSLLKAGVDSRYARLAEAGMARHRLLLVRKCIQRVGRQRPRATGAAYVQRALRSARPPFGLTPAQLLYLYAPPLHGALSAVWRPVETILRHTRR